MTGMLKRLKDYLLTPETGAGLLYVALAFGILREWLLYVTTGRNGGVALATVVGRMATGEQGIYLAWTAISFALSAWLAFLLLRRQLTARAMQRVLLVAVIHALGAIRFYDWGLMLLSVLPLFAIIPALLFPRHSR